MLSSSLAKKNKSRRSLRNRGSKLQIHFAFGPGVQRASGLFLSLRPTSRIASPGGEMDYQIDLDPTNSVIRLSVTAEIVTLELAEDIYIRLARITSRGGPYAAIFDLSG